jgi:uncharacterized repeat protein (TIGR01451 family)
VLLNLFRNPAIAAPSLKGEYRAWLYAALAVLMLTFAGFAYANQVQTSSSGAAPTVTKTYPSTLNYTSTIAGARVAYFNPSVALNSTGGVTSAQLSPQIAATTNAIDMDISANGCVFSTFRCANRGTLTLTFNKAVTNPVIHLSGLGGRTGTTSFYHTSLNMTSWVAPTTPTLTLVTGTSNLTVTGNEIRSPTINGGTTCSAAPLAGCGSVRVNGTITSVTFQIDLLMGGSTNPTATATDGWTYTVSVDEDFGDAPNSYQASPVASHIVGGLYLGTSVTPDNVAVTNSGALATSPIANATASSDVGDDGVTFPTLVRGIGSTIDVAVTGTGGQLQGWIDWAGDGNFTTAGDRIATNAIDGGAGDADLTANGVIRLAVTPPAGATQTTAKARFRVSTTASLGINGMASDGEVEDYEVIVYPQRADLSLTKTVSNATPTNGNVISYTLTAASATGPASNVTATGITVQDTLPTGFSFLSASGVGTYSSGTGVWSVGSLAPGTNASITITGTVTATSGTVTNIAQVTASSVPDPDSTVNNGATGEDDYASVAFSVASIMAAPVCPAGGTNQIIANGTFSSGTGPNWTNWSGTTPWVGTTAAGADDNTTTGSLSQSGLTGLKFGPSAGGGAVIQLSQWWRNGNPAAGSTTAQLTVSVAGTPYARLSTDPNAGTTATIVYLNGATGNLTTITEFASTGWRINLPTTVAATGAIAFTFAPGGGTSDDVEIDNVTLYTCTPGQLSVTKISSVLTDYVSAANPKSIPGALVRYCILVTNTGSVTTSNVSVSDPIPPEVTYVAGSMTSGTGCGTAATAEDDDAAGGDESDPFGMSITGSTITGTAATLAVGASYALVFNATID